MEEPRTVLCQCIKSNPREVFLHEGIDPRFLVGMCTACEKRYVIRADEHQQHKFDRVAYLSKRIPKKKFSGFSKQREDDGQFQAIEGR